MISKILHLLKALIWAAIGAFLIWFSVNNHSSILISFYPFGYSLYVPLWGILFAGIFIGLVAAGLTTGFHRLNSFISKRKIARQRDQLQKDNHILSEQAHAAIAELSHQRVNAAADQDSSKFTPGLTEGGSPVTHTASKGKSGSR